MKDRGTEIIETRLTPWLSARLPHGLAELLLFFVKQAWAALFGLLFLAALLLSKAIWQSDWALARYDALFVFAVVTQFAMLHYRLESWAEARVIVIFHLTGTIMELFKTHVGSWSYPEPALIRIEGVPLFSGFMYASVGSYIARATRIFEMRFAPYPPLWLTFLFGAAIYINFFSHHFIGDYRWYLIALSVVIFGRTRVWFYIGDTPRWMPMPVGAFLCSIILWIAEFVGTTLTGTWLYAGQSLFERVSFAKMGSWYMLLFVAFTTVTLVSRHMLVRAPIRPEDRTHAGKATATP